MITEMSHEKRIWQKEIYASKDGIAAMYPGMIYLKQIGEPWLSHHSRSVPIGLVYATLEKRGYDTG